MMSGYTVEQGVQTGGQIFSRAEHASMRRASCASYEVRHLQRPLMTSFVGIDDSGQPLCEPIVLKDGHVVAKGTC